MNVFTLQTSNIPTDHRVAKNIQHRQQHKFAKDYHTFFFFSYPCDEPWLVSQETVIFICRVQLWDKPPFSFVRKQDSSMWDIVWVSPQGHRSVSVRRHFLLQAPQCPCSVRKWFTRDHCCRGSSKPGCRIVGSHNRWELTTWADFQLCHHRLLMSAGCKSSYSGFRDVSGQL